MLGQFRSKYASTTTNSWNHSWRIDHINHQCHYYVENQMNKQIIDSYIQLLPQCPLCILFTYENDGELRVFADMCSLHEPSTAGQEDQCV